MELFAVINKPDNEKRAINSHPLLRRLPEDTAKLCLPFISVLKTGSILDKESNENLGCLLDVPRFFLDWDKLDRRKRIKTVGKIAQYLKKSDITVLSFPLVNLYFTAEETKLLEEHGIAVLDGYCHRLAGMLLVLKQLLSIMSKDVPCFETGIWGADTDIGRIWVEAMAEDVNNMCIGGRDYRELEQLAEHMLRTTGLACQITDRADVCVGNKNIAVLARPAEESFSMPRRSFLFHSYEYQHNMQNLLHVPEQLQGVYNIDMGWLGFPHDIDIIPPQDTYDELGILEGLFYTASRVYRENIHKSRLTFSQIKRLQSIYDIYPLKLMGFGWLGRKTSFDRFRRKYFE